MNEMKIQAFKVRQQIGEFFVAKMTAEQLVAISYSDVRALQKERDFETYLGIQRPLNEKRAREIQEYVKNYDATFPTSVILSIENSLVRWDSVSGLLILDTSETKSSAKILDGQHRVAGFMDLKTFQPIHDLCFFEKAGEKYPFELMVTIFVGLDLPEQANIFATVNLKQTKVSKSLVYDLENYSKTRSPQKTAHEIVMALDQHERSPFYGRIKRLGKKEGEIETLTQGSLVEEIIALISNTPMVDRDILLRQESGMFSTLRKTELEIIPLSKGIVFREFFIKNNDGDILKTILSFFLAVEGKWPVAWGANNLKSILNKAVGIKTLFRVLKYYCMDLYKEGPRVIDVTEFQTLLTSVDETDSFFEGLDATSASISKMYSRFTR